MQQPLAVPDDFDDDGEPHPEVAPRLTAEELAEQSALEVFPGAPNLTSDQWWQQGDPAHEAELAAPADAPPEVPEPEPAPFAIFGAPDAPAAAPEDVEDAGAWSSAGDDVDAEPTPEQPGVAPESGPDTPPGYEFVDQDFVEPAATSVPPASPMPYQEDVLRSVMSRPLSRGREQRDASGASQREAIMAQAGITLDPEMPDDPTSAEGQLATAMRRGAPAPAAAVATSRGFTGPIKLSLLVIVLALVALSGGAFATGQGAEVERVASTLAPDVIERWISDRVSSFGDTSPIPTASSPLGAPAVPGVTDTPALRGQIAFTGGAGVPVRSTCVPEARTPRTINEGAPVTVIARGVGDCSGWNVVRAGAAVSWVESAYIEPIPAP